MVIIKGVKDLKLYGVMLSVCGEFLNLDNNDKIFNINVDRVVY